MGLRNFIRGQFLDTIEYVDSSDKVIIYKYIRESGDNEIKNGSQVIVREGQQAVFLSKGQLADILSPGTWTLNTENLPILSSFAAIGHLFNSPIKADLYFIGIVIEIFLIELFHVIKRLVGLLVQSAFHVFVFFTQGLHFLQGIYP